MKILITEETILQMQYSRVQGRPCVVLEDFERYTQTEQQQINEAYNIMYDLLQQEIIQEFSLSGAKAKVKGKIAGVKAGLQGDSNAEDAGKQAELQSLFDDLKKNIGTIVAQHEKDVTKLGFGPEDQISKSLTQIRQAIESSPADIEIKDSSLTGKVGQFATDKVLPLISKAIKPVVDGVGILYDKSGPIKNFDTKYQQLISQISQKYPNLAEPIAKFSKFAKQHKGKATFIIGGLTAILTASGALTAGGLGAFVVGVGLRGIYGLLSGEPPAKAFGKAAITAAIGKLAGSAIKDLFGDVDLSGADETVTKAGIGEIVASVDGVEVGQAELERLGDNLGHKLQIAIDNADIEVTGDTMTGFNGGNILSSLSEDERILLRAAFMDGDTAMSGKFADEKIEQALMAVASGQSGAEEFGDEITRNLTQKFEKISEINPEQFKALSDKLDSATEISELQFDDSGNIVGDTGDAADAGGGTNPLADGGYSDPSAESALQDLDAKGLTMMHGDAQGNIKDLVAWSDEYTPTGSDFESRMLADLKATDPEKFRQHLFHTMSQAKEEEMKNYFLQLTAAAREAGVDTADHQAMMELDPSTYQAMELARVQRMELDAAYYEDNFSTAGNDARLEAEMWRDKYNAQFPDELADAETGTDVASDQAVPGDLDSFGSEDATVVDGSNYNDKIEELEELRKGFDQKSMDPEVSSDQRARYDELVKDTDDKINQLYNGGQNYRQIAKLKDVINQDIKEGIQFITDTAAEPHAAAQNLQMIKQLRANDVIHNYLDHQNKLPIDQIGEAVNVDSIKSVIEKISNGDQATINQIISFGEKEGFLPTGEAAEKLDQLEAHLTRTAR